MTLYSHQHSQAGMYTPPRQLGGATIWLAIVITSFFYVLPLGRFSIGGLQSDFRLYDFVIIITFLTLVRSAWPALRNLWRQRSLSHGWMVLLIVLVWASMAITAIWGGVDKLPPTLLRAFRFTAYLTLPTLIVVSVKKREQHRFLVNVFYLNIIVQALLGFAQGLGWLSDFWPEYWRPAAYLDYPVGTLSPHHLQMGIVMMMGIMLSFTYFRTWEFRFGKPLLGGLVAVMIATMIMAGIRTAWVGTAAMMVAFLWIYRQKAIWLVAAMGIGSLFIFQIIGSPVRSQVVFQTQSELNSRLFEVVDNQGLLGVFEDRSNVYDNYDDVLFERAWVLLVGGGFQNISAVLGGPTGAHNNYVQVWLELGILGLIVYLYMLIRIMGELTRVFRAAPTRFERILAGDVWVIFIGILVTMIFGETLWAQYSMFTLSGQILALIGLATCPLFWPKPSPQAVASSAP